MSSCVFAYIILCAELYITRSMVIIGSEGEVMYKKPDHQHTQGNFATPGML